MSPTPTHKPAYFKKKFKKIMSKVDALERQTEFTERDVAISADLCQQYSDVLQEMLDSKIELDTTVTAKVGNKLLRFENDGQMTDWLAGVLHG